MRKLLSFLILLLLTFSITFSQTWNSTLTLNTSGLNHSSDDRFDLYTDLDGIHIIIHQSSKVHHYLYDIDGLHIRHSERASFTESPRYSRITGYDGDIYIIYKNGSYIYTQKSSNAGSTWSTSIDEIELDYSTSNGINAVSDQNGVHVVWAEEQSTDHFETYYRKLPHNNTQWTDFKNVTDYSGEEGGAPSLTTAPSINKIYVVYSDRDESDDSPPHNSYPSYLKLRIKQSSTWLNSETIDEMVAWNGNIIVDDDDLNSFGYIAGDASPDVFYYHLEFWNRDRDYTSGSFSNISYDLIPGNADVDEKYRIDIAKSLDNTIHFVYGGNYYREWDGSDLSDDYDLPDLGPYQISTSGNDVFCVESYNDNGTLKFKLKQKDYDPPAVTISKVSDPTYPKFNWSKPCLDVKEYVIWKWSTSVQSWEREDSTESTNFIDTSELLDGTKPWHVAKYKVKVKDNNDNLSNYSNELSFTVTPSQQKPIVGEYPQETVPQEFSLKNVYPNPFNPETNLQFDIPEASHVKIDVFNISGQIVSELVNRNTEPGIYSAKFFADNLPSGIYIVRMIAISRTGIEFNAVQRMLLLK